MDRETIIRMAEEAGLDPMQDTLCSFDGFEAQFTKFAQLVAAHEREQIAKMVEGQKVMTLEPCKPFADERVRAIKESQRHLVKMIRARK